MNNVIDFINTNRDRYVDELKVAVADHEAASAEWQHMLKDRGWPQGNPLPVPVFEGDELIEVFNRLRAAEAAVSAVLARAPEA